MATGNAPNFPDGIFSSVKTLTATIAMELGEVPFGSTHYHALFVVGAVLFVMTFVINLLGEVVMGVWKPRG
jgi:phosphate transport system permease protein